MDWTKDIMGRWVWDCVEERRDAAVRRLEFDLVVGSLVGRDVVVGGGDDLRRAA